MVPPHGRKGHTVETQQEAGGDYGYDLAHDDVPASSDPTDPLRQGRDLRSEAERPPQLDQDYGYDEAHSF